MSLKIEQKSINKINKIIQSGKPGIVTIKGTKIRIDPVQQKITTHSNTQTPLEISVADERTGGILPLLALIPIIAGAIGAAGGVASGVATAVKAGNDRSHQLRMEDIAREKGVTIKAGEGIKEEKEPSKADIIQAILTLHKAGFSIMRV